MTLELSPHVRVAIDQDVAILLDLRRNLYLRAPAEAAQAAGVMEGRQLDPNSAFANALVQRGMAQAAKAHAPKSWRTFAGVMASCWWAEGIIQRKRLDLVETGLRVLLASALSRSARATAIDVKADFERYRCFYPRDRVCLFDSLALMHWMAANGAEAAIVFGVRVRPFGAHAWVEVMGAPVNDFTGQAHAYRSIYRIAL